MISNQEMKVFTFAFYFKWRSYFKIFTLTINSASTAIVQIM